MMGGNLIYKINFCALIVSFFLSETIRAQYAYKDLLVKSKTEVFTEKKIDSILNSFSIKDSVYAVNAHGFSYFFYKKKKNYDLAIKYGDIEIKTLENLKLVNYDYANALYNVGKFYRRKKEYNKAIPYFKKAIRSNASNLKIAQSYCELGESYFRKGDYFKAIDFYLKGLPLLKKYKRSYIANVLKLAEVCIRTNTQKSIGLGISFLDEIRPEVLNSSKMNKVDYLILKMYNCYAVLYALEPYFDFKKANYYHKLLLSTALDKNIEGYIITAYVNLGELYLNQNKDSSLYFLKKSLNYNKNRAFEAYRNIAVYHSKKNNYNLALKYIDSSLTNNFKVKSIKKISSLSNEQILDVQYKWSAMNAVLFKVEALMSSYNSLKERRRLYKVLETVALADKLLTTLVIDNTESSSKFMWREKISKIFALGAKAAFLLEDTELMYSYMEKNKAFLLSQDIANNSQILELPNELVKKNLDYKKQILALESQNLEVKASKKRDSLLKLKQDYEHFLLEIEEKYPQNFLNYSEGIKQVSLNEVISKLLNNEVLLSYNLGYLPETKEEELIGLLVSKNKTIPFVVPNTPETLINLKEYQQLISKPLANKKEMNRFNEVAHDLYNSLFPSTELRELIKKKKLSVVQDVSLENIPFEALITNKEQQRYLIEDCDINYFYSSSFLAFNNKQKRKNDDSISLFAPINFENKKLTSLDNSKNELETIENVLGGNLYLHKKASKYNFLKNTTSSKIIHLATHASSTGSPQIHFQDSTLQLHELYTYKNNADLVVLSACETNIGEVKKGEGTLNLARGFFYSGAKSVISSLWNVNDQSTSYLMKEFYTNLSSGKSKISSISEAKRSYLQQHQLSERSPYYWASFVLIGDTAPVSGDDKVLYYIVLGMLLLGIIFFIKRG